MNALAIEIGHRKSLLLGRLQLLHCLVDEDDLLGALVEDHEAFLEIV